MGGANMGACNIYGFNFGASIVGVIQNNTRKLELCGL
jgi:hypothetical protein